MAKGNEIIVSADPKGVFIEGTISGALKPGICMQVKAATEPTQGNNYTWEAFNQASDGTLALVAVLLPDQLRGKLATDAYVDGDHCFLYCPVAGEHLNMLVADVAGTGTSSTENKAIGDRMMIDDTTGKLVDDSSGASVPFIIMETQAEPISADALIRCMYTGH